MHTEQDFFFFSGYFLQKVEIKDYNVMVDEQKLFDQPVKNDLRAYDKQ